jgi:hypothetical protein
MDETRDKEESPLNKDVGCAGCFGFIIACTIILIIVVKYLPTTPRPPDEPTPPVTGNWYQGGTLHRSTVKEWLSATPENRLATASDFVAASKDRFQFKNMDQLKVYSIQMNSCITEAAKAKADQTASELAASCTIMLGK